MLSSCALGLEIIGVGGIECPRKISFDQNLECDKDRLI